MKPEYSAFTQLVEQMITRASVSKHTHAVKLKHFTIRSTAKLCIVCFNNNKLTLALVHQEVRKHIHEHFYMNNNE